MTLAAVAALLRRHLPADDPLAAYPDALEHQAHGLGDQVLRGYLTGSIDGVLRGPDGRFVVVDYKTNWLGPVGPTGREPLTAAHYGPTAMATAMIGAHYPLQAVLYAVALHRFLRWRLRGYDPATHLGWRALPVPARHVRPGHPGRRGHDVRGLRVVAAARARRRAQLPARRGPAVSAPTVSGDLLAEEGIRFATRATGLLAAFNARGVLAPTDVHVARRLGRLGGEDDEQVLLAAALVVRALRAGSVCLDLAAVDRTVLAEGDEVVDTSDLPWPDPAPWTAAVAASPLVADDAATAAGRPLRLVDGLLYLDRYWRQEEQVRATLAQRAAAPPPDVDEDRLHVALDRLFRARQDGEGATR